MTDMKYYSSNRVASTTLPIDSILNTQTKYKDISPQLLKPHQEDAIRHIISTFKDHDRAAVILPCGAGKTRVGQSLAEQMSADLILVLVPSLALLSQTRREWKQHSQKPFESLCVCSDSSVGSDEDALTISNVDFPVTTKPLDVRLFIQKEPGRPKVIFCTYQSAFVIGAAIKEKPIAFDFAVFDEAHKTAGKLGKTFSFALHDENIHIKKRLFMTATPKHVKIRTKDGRDTSEEAYSMERAATGRGVMRLGMSRARGATD